MTDPVDWELARRVAVRAAGREPLADSYLAHSLAPDFAEFTPLAEELVAAETGLHSLHGAARAEVIGREEWIGANIASFQRLLRPLADKLGAATSDGPMGTVTRKVAAFELGSVLGWMSRRVLGQYDLLFIDDDDAASTEGDVVYYVGPNILSIEKRFSFPPREFRLWLALHELTHRAQFTGVPWLRPHFMGLVEQTLDSVDTDPDRMIEGLKRLRAERKEGRNALKEGGLAMVFATPEQRAVIDQISGMMSLLEGHGDVTMGRAGEGRVPSAERFHRTMHERRNTQGGIGKLMQRLLGLEAKLAQYEQGERFIEAVEAERGPRALDAVWIGADRLPTIDEIRAPQQWLDRVPPLAAA